MEFSKPKHEKRFFPQFLRLVKMISMKVTLQMAVVFSSLFSEVNRRNMKCILKDVKGGAATATKEHSG